MDASEIGPITKRMYQGVKGKLPPAFIREWGGKLEHPGQFIVMCAGNIKRKKGNLGWAMLSTAFGPDEDWGGINEVPAANVERLLAPLAHEGRIRIMQALFDNPLGATDLVEATGFRGGALYHHLRELQHADYVIQEEGRYRLTQLGCELLVSVSALASQLIEDRGEQGLGIGTQWQEPGQ